MSETKRGRGRPPKPPFERKRHNMTFRIRDLTRERMEAAAQAAQLSNSEWVEQLIEAHFAGQDQRGLIRDEIRAALIDHDLAVLSGGLKIERQFQVNWGKMTAQARSLEPSQNFAFAQAFANNRSDA